MRLVNTEAGNHILAGGALVSKQAGENAQNIFLTGGGSQALAPFPIGQQFQRIACFFHQSGHLPQRHQPVIKQIEGMSAAFIPEGNMNKRIGDIVYRGQVQVYLHIRGGAQLYAAYHGATDKVLQLPNAGGKGTGDITRAIDRCPQATLPGQFHQLFGYPFGLGIAEEVAIGRF